ncbi:diacylglycerol kinase family protein [Natronococcus sp. A-GB7]|uniref:diacylglycerol/lipid kinase family protein n=1 Tax=Natronococcus sp. A-GB7 TaxID=3037649 RepID=UPI00241F2544|nr:diacylglycerol kinase family protein [Natronococcus sp. A-GB7]MDG5817699.1 diacylglycerol kinase family lipid kinase [Natronococcus sp. A-GB7]
MERDVDRVGQSSGDVARERRTDADHVVICNPVSGTEDHLERVRTLARERGFSVRITEGEGDGVRFAREAGADGAELVVASGGDGTINEVVNGLAEAEALERTTLAVVPTGTGNNFASNLGIDGVGGAFDAIDTGRRRRIDLGTANGRAFVNSCVGGLTAEASGATTPDEKRRLGVLAYVSCALETISSFDSLPIRATLEGGPDGSDANAPETWTGEAMLVLVGNCRRFGGTRRAQANVEDGLFEVTIVEDAPTTDLVGEAALAGLFERGERHIVRHRVSSLTLESLRSEPIEYSLDGEMLDAETLELETEANTLEVVVGDRYRPDPDAAGGQSG